MTACAFTLLAPTSRSDDGQAPQPKREAKHQREERLEHQREAKHEREERLEHQCQAEHSVQVPGVRSDVRPCVRARLAPKELARRRRCIKSHQVSPARNDDGHSAPGSPSHYRRSLDQRDRHPSAWTSAGLDDAVALRQR